MARHSSLTRSLLALAAFSLVAASCGGDDDNDSAAADEAAEAEIKPVEGCGEEAATDPSLLEADRAVARCESGAPAPQPLDEKQSVTIASVAQVETTAWLYMAQQQGEFEAENLEVEFAEIGFAEAMPQLLTGEVQATAGGAEAGWYNAVGSDIPITWVLGNFFPPHAGDIETPQTGLWVRSDVFSDPENPDFSELNGKVLGSAVGKSSVIMYPITEALNDLGVDLESMDVQELPPADVLTALQNGSVDAAWLLDPAWVALADDSDYVLAASQPPVEPLGGLFFGDQLLTEDREVGLAIIRAIVRTINTHLADDYQADTEVVDALAEALDSDPDAITGGDSLVFDWEIREGTTDRTQEAFEELGVLSQDLIDEGELVDRSLYQQVVGRE